MHAPPLPPAAIAAVVIERLVPRFEALCEERYGGLLDLRPADRTRDLTTATVHFVLERPPSLEVKGTLVVRHVGGNVYDIQSIVDDNPQTVVSLTHCLSEEDRPTVTSHLARKLATHLLDTTERLVGRQFLQEYLGAPFPKASPPSTRDRPKRKS